jgi:hypothetical protein
MSSNQDDDDSGAMEDGGEDEVLMDMVSEDEEAGVGDEGDEGGDEFSSTEIADDASENLTAHSKDVFCLSLSSSSRWLASGSG